MVGGTEFVGGVQLLLCLLLELHRVIDKRQFVGVDVPFGGTDNLLRQCSVGHRVVEVAELAIEDVGVRLLTLELLGEIGESGLLEGLDRILVVVAVEITDHEDVFGLLHADLVASEPLAQRFGGLGAGLLAVTNERLQGGFRRVAAGRTLRLQVVHRDGDRLAARLLLEGLRERRAVLRVDEARIVGTSERVELADGLHLARLVDERGGDGVGTDLAGLQRGPLARLARGVEGLHQRLDGGAVVLDLIQANNTCVELVQRRDDLVLLALEFLRSGRAACVLILRGQRREVVQHVRACHLQVATHLGHVGALVDVIDRARLRGLQRPVVEAVVEDARDALDLVARTEQVVHGERLERGGMDRGRGVLVAAAIVDENPVGQVAVENLGCLVARRVRQRGGLELALRTDRNLAVPPELVDLEDGERLRERHEHAFVLLELCVREVDHGRLRQLGGAARNNVERFDLGQAVVFAHIAGDADNIAGLQITSELIHVVDEDAVGGGVVVVSFILEVKALETALLEVAHDGALHSHHVAVHGSLVPLALHGTDLGGIGSTEIRWVRLWFRVGIRIGLRVRRSRRAVHGVRTKTVEGVLGLLLPFHRYIECIVGVRVSGGDVGLSDEGDVDAPLVRASDLADGVDDRIALLQHEDVVAVEVSDGTLRLALALQLGHGLGIDNDVGGTGCKLPLQLHGVVRRGLAVGVQLDAVLAEVDGRLGAVVDLDRLVTARSLDVFTDDEVGCCGIRARRKQP